MFQLKGDFGTLLGRLAVFEYVGEMICFAHVHQKLRLRTHGVHIHTLSARRGGQRREIHMSGEVLLAWRLIRV